MKRSLRLRLTVSQITVVTVALGIFSIFFYVAARHALWTEFDEGLASEADALGRLVEEHSNGRFVFESKDATGGGLFDPGVHAAYFQFWTPTGAVLARSASLAGRDLPRLPRAAGTDGSFFERLPDGRNGRFLQLRLVARWESHSQPRPPAVRHRITVVVAHGTAHVDGILERLRLWLIALWLIAALMAGAVAAIMVRRGLRPADTLAAEIGRIDEYNLGERLSIAELPAELTSTVTKVNEMLARLEESFARERRFTADVSHELRTPLAGLRMILEVASSRPRAAADYRAAVEEAMRIVHQMQAMVENLLMLARLDAEQIEVLETPIALRAFVDECWSPFVAQATERQLVWRNEIPTEAVVVTDADKLRLVVANLLSNAVEYTASGGTVVVRGGAVVLDVQDSGPPIPEAVLPKLFDRFYRAEASRSAGVHCGIGLSLVKALCEVLGLEVGARNLPDGSVRFRIVLDPNARRRRPRNDPGSAAAA